MKVLAITNMFPTDSQPYSGVFVREQIDALRSAGVEVEVLHINGSRKLNYIRGILTFWKRIRESRFDIIHAHYVHCGWIARLQRGVPIVVSSHGSDTLGYECWFLRRLRPLVDAMTITSRQNQERSGLLDTYLLPCGVNTDLFRPQDQSEARKQLAWDCSRKYMLYVGRDTPRKRLDILRDAHRLVKATRDDVDLVLATSLPHSDVPTYMNAADVFVFASETEGSPVVIKEALACNLPIVSVDVGDVTEMIESVSECYVCPRTPESIAAAVLRVLEHGRRSNGREVALRFSLDSIAARIMEIYRAALDARSAHTR